MEESSWVSRTTEEGVVSKNIGFTLDDLPLLPLSTLFLMSNFINVSLRLLKGSFDIVVSFPFWVLKLVKSNSVGV